MSAEPDSDAKHELLGRTVAGYRLTRLLGQGGMGAVFEGERDPEAGANEKAPRVAVKVLHERLAAADHTAYQRFMQEARTTSRVDHPTLVKVLDFGQLDDGWAFIVMELLTGELLRQRLRRSSPLPISLVQRIGIQLASGLGASHAKGIIHRDLKPENVMLVMEPGQADAEADVENREQIRILDFGIAKIAAATGSETLPGYKTATGAILGSPAYMSPEQCRGAGAEITDRSDVYSLGIVFYEMLAGGLPFQSKGAGELIVMHLMESPTPLLERAPATPRALAQLVDRMLRKKISERPSMREVAETLLLLDQGESTVAGGRQALQTRRIGWDDTVVPALRRRKLLRFGSIAGAVIVLGMMGLLVMSLQNSRGPAPTGSSQLAAPLESLHETPGIAPSRSPGGTPERAPERAPERTPEGSAQPAPAAESPSVRAASNKNRKSATKKSLGNASRPRSQPDSESNELHVKPTL